MKTRVLLPIWVCFLGVIALPAAEIPRELERLRAEVSRNPADATAQKRLAAYCLKEFREAEAVGASGAAIVSAPNDVEANRLYVTALARSGRYREALDASRAEALAVRPDVRIKKITDAALLAQQAEDLVPRAVSRTNFHNIAESLERAVSMDSDNLSIRLMLGWIYLDKIYDPGAAYLHVAFVARRHPSDPNALKLYASACRQTGRNSEAVSAFRDASHLQPEDLWVKANLGRALAQTGRRGEAEKIYAEVLQADPSNVDARLGKAELAAWRGQSGKALEILQEVQRDNPTNAEAITLAGDVHRWKWDLTEARQDYQRALVLSPDNYAATTGLEDIEERGSPDIHVNAYQFEDTSGFQRESGGGGVRIGVTDKIYLLARAAAWRFRQSNVTNITRFDGMGGVEVHWARWLETTVEAGIFNYDHRDAFPGGTATAKLTPLSGLDLYAGAAYQPFVSSLATVTNGLKEKSAGGGVDMKLWGRFSVQNTFKVARISDRNTWWEDRPQLSYRLFGANPGTFLRVQYTYLHYQNTNAGYFSPQHWSSLAPVLDTTIPFGKCFRLIGDARAPYIFKESKFGAQLQGGPAVDLFNRRMRISGAYIYSSIPGDQGNWSGHGWQAAVKLIL